MSVGENIKKIRNYHSISLEQLSAMTGIAIEDCEKIESGSRTLSSAEVQSICKALNVNFDTLVMATFPEPDEDATEGSVLMPVEELQNLLGKMKE